MKLEASARLKVTAAPQTPQPLPTVKHKKLVVETAPWDKSPLTCTTIKEYYDPRSREIISIYKDVKGRMGIMVINSRSWDVIAAIEKLAYEVDGIILAQQWIKYRKSEMRGFNWTRFMYDERKVLSH